MMQEHVRDSFDKKIEKAPRYEMRPRKSKLFIDLNNLVIEEEHGIKDGSKVKTLIKTKVEDNREMDNNRQVQALKKKMMT
jgi:mRNA-degrading endonuclease RelE of RelBE toxin-antitoxin system